MQLAANMNDSPISPIEDILEDARNGRPYILVDAEDRENEGDIIIPAQFATPDQINFMIRQARGLVCLALTAERANQLRLPPMAADNRESMKTAFTVSIEAKEGVTTGISAADRSRTIHVATDASKGMDDIVSPDLTARDEIPGSAVFGKEPQHMTHEQSHTMRSACP
ncbi:3,4-dihydroxy-2-butanone-4-phosphate synthase, partial [Brevundimonas sp.]|uniref:3,4-dihydroxy-2-butanone-4-phosphate synthase n=1 Tax=Brevundimonas sp. TaxID=1871086 RepID=UPI002ABC7CED